MMYSMFSSPMTSSTVSLRRRHTPPLHQDFIIKPPWTASFLHSIVCISHLCDPFVCQGFTGFHDHLEAMEMEDCVWILCDVAAALAAVVMMILFWYLTIASRSKGRASESRLPPGSCGMPIVGETIMYMSSMKKSMPTFMAERRRRYGEMFRTKLMGALCVVLMTRDVIKFVLDHDGKQFETGYPSGFKKVLGKYTSLSLHDEKWRSTRRFLVNSFRVEHLKARIPVLEKLVLENLASWEVKDTVCIRDETKSVAFNVVAHFLLGSRLAESGDVMDALRRDFYVLTEGLFALPINLPGTSFYKALQARARIIDTLEKEVVSKPRPPGDEDHYADYMEYLRKENLPGTTEALLLEQTRCHVLGLMFAGHETAACTMLFAVKYILEDLSVLEQLRVEHDGIRKSKLEGEFGLTWDDYKSMRYTQHVITETIRLANPVALLWRVAKEDVKLSEYVVPKGYKVVCAIREAHHDTAYFNYPYVFDPSRHEKEVTNPADKPPFFGFGGGPRYCPGAELARLEMSIFLHHLVTKFDLAVSIDEGTSFFPIPKIGEGLQVRPLKRIPRLFPASMDIAPQLAYI